MRDNTADLICGLCHGLLIFIGLLGDLAWYRCRDCGAEFSHRVTRPDEDENEPSQ